MLAKPCGSHVLAMPVAILDKRLCCAEEFRVELHELCSMCGARYGIGHLGAPDDAPDNAAEMEELLLKLSQILAKDHRQHRDHKDFIELDL